MPKLEWTILQQDKSITQPLIDMFRNVSARAEVETTSIPWDGYKEELTSMAFHGRGADVSQAGAPVVNDLVAMNVLRPFTAREMDLLGGETAFTEIAWQNNLLHLVGDKVWAIPLFSDPFPIVYWSDLLERAGVDETQAFTLDHIEETFERLQASGIEYPWLLNFHNNKFIPIHTAASWVWAHDTDFVSQNGREALFTGTAALAGLQAYYRLGRFISPVCLQANHQENDQLFLERRAAATMCGIGVANNMYKSLPAELRPLLKVALPPGPPLVGGSSLVIWNTTHVPDPAFNLVKLLTSPEVQAFYPLQIGQMPVRQEVLRQPPFTTEPLLQSYVDILKYGRIFPLFKFSGLLEDQLAPALTRIWHTVLSEPSTDLETMLLRTLSPIANRYNSMMH